jgi:hypothetical protein
MLDEALHLELFKGAQSAEKDSGFLGNPCETVEGGFEIEKNFQNGESG